MTPRAWPALTKIVDEESDKGKGYCSLPKDKFFFGTISSLPLCVVLAHKRQQKEEIQEEQKELHQTMTKPSEPKLKPLNLNVEKNTTKYEKKKEKEKSMLYKLNIFVHIQIQWIQNFL